MVIEKRFWYAGPYYNDYYYDRSPWERYGRWILLGVIILLFVVAFFVIQGMSCRRVRRGQQPVVGTGWMVPPSYYQSQQQNQNDTVPRYKQEVGEGDAGHYDQNGQFIPANNSYQHFGHFDNQPANRYYQHTPYDIPNNTQNPPSDPPSQQNPPQVSDYYQPPPNPPPGASSLNVSSSDAPPHPPPAKVKN